MSKIYGFHHICFDKNGRTVFEEQLKTLYESGLYEASEVIFCTFLGSLDNYKLPPKYKIIYLSTNSKAYERPILEYMYEQSTKLPGKYWYIHTKGVSHYGTEKYERVRDWRIFMEYFVITNWRRCVKDLEQYDVAGANYATNPSHYSGNFWWATSNYIKTNKPNFNYNDYYETEMWLCKQKSLVGISYHQSNIIHYENRYPPSNYVNYPQMSIIFSPGISETICDFGQTSHNLDYRKFKNY
jgi:hypothetical protein